MMTLFAKKIVKRLRNSRGRKASRQELQDKIVNQAAGDKNRRKTEKNHKILPCQVKYFTSEFKTEIICCDI